MKLPELDEATLARAQAGDRSAFRALYERYADVVYAFVRRMLFDDATAEDALQDTFVRIARSLASFDPRGPAALSTWILTIARRAALTPRRPPPTVGLETTSTLPPPVELSTMRRRLEDALAALSPEQRAVFVLRECAQLSYDEIAIAVEADVGTVRSRLHRARAALQERLRDLMEHTEGEGRGRKAGR
ncbi:MAG: polymerase sigma factor RpoE [Myxococcales bacterium]|nr:polymerase sigma factor RpoE [Myxococcales bacterium]